MTQSPFVVLWRVMDHCNLSCPFCAYDRRLAIPRSQVDRAEMSRMISLLSSWQDEAGRPVVLSWLGGEPTIWPAFSGLADEAARAGLRQSLTTNATTLGSAMLRERLVSDFAEVTFSVDAIGKTHEDLRGWRGGFAKLAQWVPRLAEDTRAAQSPLKLRANVVLMRQTLGDFGALCHRLADWGITTITFNQLGGRDRPEYYPAHRLRPEDVARLRADLPGLRMALAARGVTVLGAEPYVQRIVESARGQKLPISSCQVARDFLFIDEACRIAPCAFVGDHFEVRTQNIRSVSDLQALTSGLCAAQAAHPADACADCMSTQQFSKFAA